MLKKQDLIEMLVSTGKVATKKAAGEIIDALTSTIKAEVAKGEKVSIYDFGTFEAVKMSARQGYNPQKHEAIMIPEKTVPKFTAAKKFKDAVNENGKGE